VRRFAELYEALDSTTSTAEKVEHMSAYFAAAPPEDAVWALFFLTGQRLKRLLPAKLLREWTLEVAGIPGWLLDESYAIVGDSAETIALLLGRPGPRGEASSGEPLPLHAWLRDRILPLRGADPKDQRRAVLSWWSELNRSELYILNKLLTGELRVGVSATLVVRAIAKVAGTETAVISHRLMGTWNPTPEFFLTLIAPQAEGLTATAADLSRPYPFYLASPIEGPPHDLGDLGAWLVDWKWDGIRAQLMRRGGHIYLWSRGEELITDRFPELLSAAARLPDGTVLDGEVLAFRDGLPMPFSVLQRRIGRKVLGPKILADAPAAFIAYDLLEDAGADVRSLPLEERRSRLERILSAPALSGRFMISPLIQAASWDEVATLRESSRERRVEGVMIKRAGSPYGVGRRKGDWWKWKIGPHTVDAVLIYAQPGHGRRANLLTDYTFAVWDQAQLVPVAKAYSGLSNDEIAELDRWIRQHTAERFGPVRAVEPSRVYELGFEAIAPSPRHRSGVAVRFPRILRPRPDKPAAEADTLDRLKAMLPPAAENGGPKKGRDQPEGKPFES
jgi:DNA ligase-1